MPKATRHLVILGLLFTSFPISSLADDAFRDPTRPYTAAERSASAAPRFVVNAIIVSDDRRVAIVNGRRVSVGSSLGGATVIAIDKHQLILDIGGKRITAGLNDGAMR